MKSACPRRIKILFILNSCGTGGAEIQVVNLLNGLAPERFDVFLVYLRDEKEVLSRLSRNHVRAEPVCLFEKSSFDLVAFRRFSRLLRSEKFDIAVCTNMHPLIYAWLARFIWGANFKIVEVFHSTSLRGIKSKLKMVAFYPICWCTDTLIYVCKNQLAFWQKRFLFARRSLVIYNGVDPAQFVNDFASDELELFRRRHGFEADDYIVGICAYLRPEKFHRDLLAAISLARAAGSNVRCLIIGDGPERQNIESSINELNLVGHVRITGLLSDVRLALASTDVITITSHFIETFSISALEAMSLGKPLIMTEIGGAAEQITHGINGYLYQPGDISALAVHIQTLAAKECRMRMGRAGREMVKGNFSLGRMVEQYSAFFQSLPIDGEVTSG